MSTNVIKPKTYLDSLIYKKLDCEKKLVDFIMKETRVDKEHSSFKDIVFDVKRRSIDSLLVTVLESKKTVIMISERPLPKSLKVFISKDIKNNNDITLFIEADNIREINGEYKCRNIDILCAYLFSGMTSMLYNVDPKSVVLNSSLTKYGTSCFSALVTRTVDYIGKISTIQGARNICMYLSSYYYIKNILQREVTDSLKNMIKSNSKIDDKTDYLISLQIDEEKDFDNIETFIQALSRVLNLPGLTFSLFLEKWIFLYQPGTEFALELFPSFASMMSNVYIGCYINNQRAIEQVVGRDCVDFCTTLLDICKGVMK